MCLSGDVLSDHSFVFFKQKTAYEMRISDWSSDVCSSDLRMLDSGNTRTISLSRSAPSSDAAARASALKQVDFNARQRERLPRCNDAAPVIPAEANLRALTRSPNCNAPVRDEAPALAHAPVASQK